MKNWRNYRMGNKDGLDLKACYDSIIEGTTMIVGIGKNREEIEIVKKYPTYVLCKKNSRLGSYNFAMTYDEFALGTGTGLVG